MPGPITILEGSTSKSKCLLLKSEMVFRNSKIPFVAEGDEIEDVFKEYWIHTADEHGIGYQKEVLM